ncbi:heme-binding protein [Mycobacterium sp. SMC-4]|uniref:heme-binding protein n=1 Tax=Mycobacterium sp. SMC-4 TaxID=2857059 RepID=UPI0021B1983A|nr:heme-binding protein [Mycobacterium sp. SMC-4]UXA18326.1 heme-binding protein [Mycobacterium sp. SMC-4]
MLFPASTARRLAVGALSAGACAGAMLFGALPTAVAQPDPPNCTAADFSGVAAGVSASSSAYLFTHPEVNAFFTDLHGLPRNEIHEKVVDYMNANPQVRDELTAIRAPLHDLKHRCGFTPETLDTPDDYTS